MLTPAPPFWVVTASCSTPALIEVARPVAVMVKGGVKAWTVCSPPSWKLPVAAPIPSPSVGEKLIVGVTRVAPGESKFVSAAVAAGPFTSKRLPLNELS